MEPGTCNVADDQCDLRLWPAHPGWLWPVAAKCPLLYLEVGQKLTSQREEAFVLMVKVSSHCPSPLIPKLREPSGQLWPGQRTSKGGD
jgi:hypothetical protein